MNEILVCDPPSGAPVALCEGFRSLKQRRNPRLADQPILPQWRQSIGVPFLFRARSSLPIRPSQTASLADSARIFNLGICVFVGTVPLSTLVFSPPSFQLSGVARRAINGGGGVNASPPIERFGGLLDKHPGAVGNASSARGSRDAKERGQTLAASRRFEKPIRVLGSI
jgi:hypothetical protein